MVRKKRGFSRRTAVRLVLAAMVLTAALVYRGTGNTPAETNSGVPHAEGGEAAGREEAAMSATPAADKLRESDNRGLPLPGGVAAATAVGLAPSSSAERAQLSRPPHTSGNTVQAAAAVAGNNDAPRTVYLTFDDGPSAVTPMVLEILRRERVKATFFMLGEEAERRPELVNAVWEQGNAIGNHTYDHNYKDLYSGFTRFWRQIKQTEETLRLITGERPRLVRAPGGTSGHFDDTYFQLMKQAGYTVTDWTVDSGDSRRRGVPASEIVDNSVRDTRASRVVLLLHDGAGHEESAKALPEIIKRYKAAGYVFKTLDAAGAPVQFKSRPGKNAKARIKPAQAWIAANILPNAALFQPGKPLTVEAGLLQASLQPGEYRIENGRYIVPLRAMVERLGGRVSWDTGKHNGLAELNGRTLTATPGGALVFTDAEGGQTAIPSAVTLQGGSIWLPLRDLLEASGHPLLEVTTVPEERRVKAS